MKIGAAQALGDDKANLLIDRILQGSDVTGIESLEVDGRPVGGRTAAQRTPQIVAAILVHLDHDQVSSVLKHFTERMRNEVMIASPRWTASSPPALKDLNEVLSRVLGAATACARLRWAA